MVLHLDLITETKTSK